MAYLHEHHTPNGVDVSTRGGVRYHQEVNVLSTNQAAKRLGISRQRVHKLIQDGQIKAERQTQVKWAIPEEEVTRYAQKK